MNETVNKEFKEDGSAENFIKRFLNKTPKNIFGGFFVFTLIIVGSLIFNNVAIAANFVNDTFTDTSGVSLENHTGEIGATWAKNSLAGASTEKIDSTNRIYASTAVSFIASYQASGVPANADYQVSANVVNLSNVGGYQGVGGRMSTSATTFYYFFCDNAGCYLGKYVLGTFTVLATTSSEVLPADTSTHTIMLKMVGTSISGYFDGVLVASAIDSSITVAGRAGIFGYGTVTNATGEHMDSFTATEIATPATAYTLTGPTGGAVNTPSANFTIAPNGTYTGTINLSSTGSGTFSPSSLTWSGDASAKTFTYTPTSTTGSPHVISSISSPALTDPASISYVINPPTNIIPVNDPNWFWSPYDTYISGPSTALMLTMGSYGKVNFTGTSASLNVDLSAYVNASISAPNYSTIIYKIDDLPSSTLLLTSSTNTITLASGLSSGSHSLYFQFISDCHLNDHWLTPVVPIKVTGLSLDIGASTAQPTLLNKRALFYGDSITGGYTNIVGGVTYVPLIASYLNSEYGKIGYAGQNWSSGASDGTTPGFTTSWSNYYSGHSRLIGGFLTPAPDYVFVNMGQNGGAVASTVTTWMSSLRSAAPLTKLFIIVPFSGSGRANITTGFNNYVSTNPSDTKVYLLDLGSISYPTSDGIHPTVAGHAILATALENQLNSILDLIPPSAPTATPSAGTYNSTQSVTLSVTGSDYIKYSLTEIPATCSVGILYTVPISVSTSQTIYALACDNAGNSSTQSFAYVIAPVVSHSSNGGSSPYAMAQFKTAQQPTAPVVTSTPSAPFTPIVLSRIIKLSTLRMWGDDVLALQTLLNTKGYNVGTPDGNFGPKTQSAVVAFQKSNGLVPDGSVGSNTLKYLNGDQTTTTTSPITIQPTVTRILKLSIPRMIGDDVLALQTYLSTNGYDVGTLDGVLGNKTKTAIIAFQTANGLTPDGLVGAKTREMMK